MVRFAAQTSVLFASAVLVGAVASADITIEEKIGMEGAGAMHFMNMNGTSVTKISGMRARTDSNIEMQSGVMRMFLRGGPTAQIVKLEDDKVYELMMKKKKYTETSLAEQRAKMQKAIEQQRQAQAQQQQSGTGIDESECEWQPPRAEVKRTGERSTIAGFDAERVIVNGVQSCKVKNSTEVCDFVIGLDQWIAPRFEGGQEVLAYQQAFAQKMGLTSSSSQDVSERAEAMFGKYKDLWSEIGTQLRSVTGYPVKTTFGFGVGGPQCQDTNQSQAQTTSTPTSSPGAIAGQIGSAIGGLFKKKDKDKPAEQPAAATTASPAPQDNSMPQGVIPLFKISSELVTVTRGSVSPDTFDVPADFEKISDSQ
jgi:hypothetical protein